MPRIVISAPQGRSGKTTVSIGLCCALRKRGLVVQPFKKGPDYIDPSWLSAAAGRPCRNLDPVMMPEERVLASFNRACRGADIAVVEGAMGLYDGFESGEQGSTAQVARLLDSPVVLVVNTARMTQSIAAMVGGYQSFQKEINIAGVVLNNVSGSRHESKLRNAIETYCGIPVLGSLPKDLKLNITERHLGLIPYRESDANSRMIAFYDSLEDCFDLDSLLEIARQVKPLVETDTVEPAGKASEVRLGVLFDQAFSFYYPENFEALSGVGAELVFINSLKDEDLPPIDGLYIGGGFPEMFLPELEANRKLKEDIGAAIEDGLPVYAECAGLMYLARCVRRDGRSYAMTGTLPVEVEMCSQPQGHGYVQVETEDSPLFPAGLTFWGHEFHYSRLSTGGGLRYGYRIRRGRGVDGRVDGVLYKNTFAAYTHLHALGVPEWAPAFVALARSRKQSVVPSAKL